MLRVMLQKVWHKKWMIVCLLLGSTLLIATVASLPLYRRAAFDRMLVDEFKTNQASSGQWPAQNKMTIISKKDKEGKSIKRMEELMGSIYSQLGVTPKNTIYYYSLAKTDAESLMHRTDVPEVSLRLAFLSEVTDHAELCGGSTFSEDGMTEEGNIEVLISQDCMVKEKLLLGETYEFSSLKDAVGNPVRVTITGVYDTGGDDSFYWQVTSAELGNVCLMKEELFRELFTEERAEKYTITSTYFSQFEYSDLKDSQVQGILEATQYLTEESPYRSTMVKPEYQKILQQYMAKRTRIDATLTLLQIPVLILLCAFLFMISGQMYDMERNEISVIKSRGSSSGQIFRLYLYQSTFLALVGALAGLPLGVIFARFLGAVGNFLEFDSGRTLNVAYQPDMSGYLLGAMAGCILIMTLPAWKHSKVSIVRLKSQRALKKRSWWEICFLDVICLGVSFYGWYRFSREEELLAQNVLSGEPLDPLLYISSSLFIIGAGLLFLRIQPLLVRLIYRLGKQIWSPASYASFQENLKNGRKQQFIMLFLIMTIGLGMLHASVARTIMQNALDNTSYLDGADLVIKEVWSDNSALFSADPTLEFQYYEPDRLKYEKLECAEEYTRVINDDDATMRLPNRDTQKVTLLGVHTKEFGECTDMPQGLLEKPYYEYLNELAVQPDGILVSSICRDGFGLKIGDKITISNGNKQTITGTIVDFVDYWPGYAPQETTTNADGSTMVSYNLLAVTHFDVIQSRWGTVPYEMWMRLKDDTDSSEIEAWLEEYNVSLAKYSNRQEDLESTESNPLLQGTNGVLTMGFLVTILLCGVGYLIYWILSIRSREMFFGVLRACGMHKGELLHMLMNEQIFSGVLSVFAGILIGKVASTLFVPVLQTAYAAANQVLPMRLITDASDLIRLYGVIAAVMLLCFCILLLLVFRMNVTKALKLGEE